MEKTILLVDDDETFKLILRNALKEKHHAVVTAKDTQEALQKLHEDSPDIMLLDLGLPGVHGMDFLKELRASNEFPDLPVLILTQETSIDQIASGYELGIRGYIVKSELTTDQIVQVIEDTLMATEDSEISSTN